VTFFTVALRRTPLGLSLVGLLLAWTGSVSARATDWTTQEPESANNMTVAAIAAMDFSFGRVHIVNTPLAMIMECAILPAAFSSLFSYSSFLIFNRPPPLSPCRESAE
jgi:hypothetical protein